MLHFDQSDSRRMQALILLLCSLFPLIVGTIFVYNYYTMWEIATDQKVNDYNQCV